VDAILREAGIQPEHSAPYSPIQNGLPYEDLTGEEADYSHMKAFGATAAFGILPSSWSARILFKSFSQRKSQSLLLLQPPVDPEPAPQDADEEKQEAGQEQEDEEPEEEQQAERRSARPRKFNKFLLDQHVVYPEGGERPALLGGMIPQPHGPRRIEGLEQGFEGLAQLVVVVECDGEEEGRGQQLAERPHATGCCQAHPRPCCDAPYCREPVDAQQRTRPRDTDQRPWVTPQADRGGGTPAHNRSPEEAQPEGGEEAGRVVREGVRGEPVGEVD